MSILQKSPHQSFRVTQLAHSIAICEALNGDRHNWENAEDNQPAFLAYVGCRKDEVPGYVKTFNNFYRCCWCEVRKPKYLKGFEAEIKVRGMQRYSDSHALGLDYLIESEKAKLEVAQTETSFKYLSPSAKPSKPPYKVMCHVITHALDENERDYAVPLDSQTVELVMSDKPNRKSVQQALEEEGYDMTFVWRLMSWWIPETDNVADAF